MNRSSEIRRRSGANEEVCSIPRIRVRKNSCNGRSRSIFPLFQGAGYRDIGNTYQG